MELILASSSPRRAEILTALGISFTVHPSEVDETVLPGELPRLHAERVAREKAEAVHRLFPDRWVLAGDTVVGLDEEILGKPGDPEEAVAILLRLSGKVHQVTTALTLVRPGADLYSGSQTTSVAFRAFDREFAAGYVRTGEPMDKAGAYGIQGKGAVLVTGVVGDYSTVVGLSVPLLLRLLEEAGAPFSFR